MGSPLPSYKWTNPNQCQGQENGDRPTSKQGFQKEASGGHCRVPSTRTTGEVLATEESHGFPLGYPRWASLDRIRGVWPQKYPGPLGPISYTNGAPTSPREFYPKNPFKTSYIHLPGLYEFYPPALAPKILYSLT